MVKSKKCLLANFIVACVAFALWLAAALVLLLAVNKTGCPDLQVGGNFVESLNIHWQGIFTAFTDVAKLPSLGYAMYRPIVVLVLAAGWLAALIAGIIVVCRKKHAKFTIYVVALVLVLLPLMDLAANGEKIYYKDLVWLATNLSVKNAILPFVIYLCIAVFGVVAIVFVYITYGLAIAFAKKFPGDYVEPAPVEEEIPELALAEQAPVEEVTEPVETEVEPLPEAVVMEEEPVVEEEKEPEQAPVEEEKEPEPVAEPAPAPVVEEKKEDPLTSSALAAMLREVVRDIVRDEIARNNANQPAPAPAPAPNGAQTITGATFGGPLVVQYFNGGINGVTPAAPVVAPAPAPVVEEKKPEPVAEPAPAPVVEEKKPEPVAEPAPAPVVVPVKPIEKPAEPAVEKKPIERIPFPVRLLASEKELIANYNEIKNEILSWGVKSRVSNTGDTFRLHTKTYVKLTVAGKSLKLYFALNPKDYRDSTIPVQDAGEKNLYVDIPLVFKVKSALSVKRCKQLIQDCMEKDGLEQGEIGTVNWAKELKAELAAQKK